MNILSIDVGMKNLAYCILKVDNNEYKIIDWDVINLCNDKKYICQFPTKKNGICEKKARFTKYNQHYCKIHAKKSDYKLPSPDLNKKKIKKSRLSELKILVDKYDISFNFIKKTKNEYLNAIIEDLSYNYLETISENKAKDLTLIDYGIKIKELFSKKFNKENVNKVLIENQIGPIALRMKTLQGMIIQHFIENNITDINCVNSSNKLKEFLGKKKTSYNDRKKFSIKYTREILEKLNSNWIELFNKHSKKDDLADCFLQCLWYLKNKNLVNK